jgi:hypothetical protein
MILSFFCIYDCTALLRYSLRALKSQQPVAGQKRKAIVKDSFSILPSLQPFPIYKLPMQMLENSQDK